MPPRRQQQQGGPRRGSTGGVSPRALQHGTGSGEFEFEHGFDPQIAVQVDNPLVEKQKKSYINPLFANDVEASIASVDSGGSGGGAAAAQGKRVVVRRSDHQTGPVLPSREIMRNRGTADAKGSPERGAAAAARRRRPASLPLNTMSRSSAPQLGLHGRAERKTGTAVSAKNAGGGRGGNGSRESKPDRGGGKAASQLAGGNTTTNNNNRRGNQKLGLFDFFRRRKELEEMQQKASEWKDREDELVLEAVELRQFVHNLASKVSTSNAVARDAQQRQEAVETEAVEMQTAVATATTDLGRARAELHAAQRELEIKSKEMQRMQNRLDELEADVSSKDNMIAKLKRALAAEAGLMSPISHRSGISALQRSDSSDEEEEQVTPVMSDREVDEVLQQYRSFHKRTSFRKPKYAERQEEPRPVSAAQAKPQPTIGESVKSRAARFMSAAKQKEKEEQRTNGTGTAEAARLQEARTVAALNRKDDDQMDAMRSTLNKSLTSRLVTMHASHMRTQSLGTASVDELAGSAMAQEAAASPGAGSSVSEPNSPMTPASPDGIVYNATEMEQRRKNILDSFDPQTVAMQSQFAGHTARVRCLASSVDGRFLFSGDDVGTVIVWDVQSQSSVGKLSAGEWPVICVCASQDYLAAGTMDGYVTIWDLASGGVRVTLHAHQGPVYSLAVTVDSSVMVSSGADAAVRIWHIQNETPLAASMEGHTGGIHAVTLSTDGYLAVSGGADGRVFLWNTASASCCGELATPNAPTSSAASTAVEAAAANADGTPGAVRPISSVSVSWDRKRIIAGRTDGTVSVWEHESPFSVDAAASAALAAAPPTGRSIRMGSRPVSAAMLVPGDQYMLCVAETVAIANPVTGVVCRTLSEATAGTWTVLAAASLQVYLAAGGDDTIVRLWR